MYPQFKTQALVKKYAPYLIAKLGMKKFKIEFHVYHSKSKALKAKGVCHTGRAGVTYVVGNRADVILFYDNLVDRKDALGTLIHELLHVLFNPFLELVTLYKDKSLRKEEALVQVLEKFIMDTLDLDKLLD